MIVPQREHIVGLLRDDLGGDSRLAAQRVDGDDPALEREQSQQERDGGNLVGLGAGGFLAQHQATGGGPGAPQMQGRLAVRPIMRPPQCFAIHRHHVARRGAGHRLDPGHETALKLPGIQPGKQAPERVARRNPTGQGQERAQLRLFAVRKGLDRHPIMGTAKHPAQGDSQDIAQPMRFGPVHAGVRQGRKMQLDTRGGTSPIGGLLSRFSEPRPPVWIAFDYQGNPPTGDENNSTDRIVKAWDNLGRTVQYTYCSAGHSDGCAYQSYLKSITDPAGLTRRSGARFLGYLLAPDRFALIDQIMQLRKAARDLLSNPGPALQARELTAVVSSRPAVS